METSTKSKTKKNKQPVTTNTANQPSAQNTEGATTEELLAQFGLTSRDLPDEEQVRINVAKNLNYLMKKNGIWTAGKLAEILEVGPSQISRFQSKAQAPTFYPFLYNVKKYFGCSIDDFLFSDLEQAERGTVLPSVSNLPAVMNMHFEGFYELAYFVTDHRASSLARNNANSIKYGMMLIVRATDSAEYRTYAIFGMKKAQADELYLKLKNANLDEFGIRDRILAYQGQGHTYSGNLKLTSNMIHIGLYFEDRDHVSIVFHRPNGNGPRYIGGLGCMLSVSVGRAVAPCLQYIGMFKEPLAVSEEEIAEQLELKFPLGDASDVTDELTQFLTCLYSAKEGDEGAGRYGRLRAQDRDNLAEMRIFDAVRELINRTQNRVCAVSDTDDDRFYHWIKNAPRIM